MSDADDDSSGPLAGIRVLDLTEFLAGPYGTQILGDLGAEVIKIESAAGDSSRSVAPRHPAGSSSYFMSINRNKKSIVLDLKSEQGRRILKELAGKCDIVYENRRPGVLARLGFDYDSLSKDHPGLIWCSVSGFGQTGPDRDAAAYDMIVQATSGGMSLTGEKGGRPVRAGIPIGDIGAGLYGVIGILAALARKLQTGKGEYIDVAMLDVQVAFLTYQASRYLQFGDVPSTQGREHDFLPTYRCFAAADRREVAVTANTDKMWVDLCAVIGRPELVADARFTSVADRNRNRSALIPELEAAFRTKPAAEWVRLLRAAGVPAGPVNDVAGAMAEPQVVHRGMVLPLESPTGETVRVPGDPLKLKNARRTRHAFPPRLGEHGRSVLKGLLGYSDADIAAMEESGALGRAAPATPAKA